MTEKNVKQKNMNVKMSEEMYNELKAISVELGGMTLSSMVRFLLDIQLEKVRKSGDPKDFLNIKE